MTPRVVIATDEFGWHGRRLADAFARLGVETAAVTTRDFRVQVGGAGDAAVPALAAAPAAFDAVFVRGVPGGTLEQVCLRMECLHELAARGVPVVNPPRTIELTVNKAATSMRLAAARLPMPETWCGESLDAALAFARAQLAAGGEVVYKPLFGSQGEGLARFASEADLTRLEHGPGVYYLQRFHGPPTGPYRDYRLFVVAGEVVGAMERVSDHWVTNRAQGGLCRPLTVTGELRDLAQRAAVSVGADYLGVDILPAPEGLLVTEVNSIPAWQGLQRVCQVDIAARLAALTLAVCRDAGAARAGLSVLP